MIARSRGFLKAKIPNFQSLWVYSVPLHYGLQDPYTTKVSNAVNFARVTDLAMIHKTIQQMKALATGTSEDNPQGHLAKDIALSNIGVNLIMQTYNVSLGLELIANTQNLKVKVDGLIKAIEGANPKKLYKIKHVARAYLDKDSQEYVQVISTLSKTALKQNLFDMAYSTALSLPKLSKEREECRNACEANFEKHSKQLMNQKT